MSSTGKRRSNARRALAPPTSAKRQKKTTPISSDETPAPDVSFAQHTPIEIVPLFSKDHFTSPTTTHPQIV